MSTTDNTSAASGTPRDLSRTQLSYPQFDAIRNAHSNRQSVAESSTSGSRWSAVDRQSQSLSNYEGASSRAESDDGKRERPVSHLWPRRHKNRTSGGFLLEPATHSSRLSRSVLSRSQQDSKGKRKSDDLDLSIPKRRSKHVTPSQDSHVPSSPLSVEVGQEYEKRRHAYENNSASPRSWVDGRTTPNGFDKTPPSQDPASQSIGFDTDPAQIVDMALRLSEGRRRQASGKRYVSTDTTGKGVTSSSSRQPQTPTRSLGQYLTSPAGRVSPLLKTSVRELDDHETIDSTMADGPLSPYTQRHQIASEEKDFEVSQATIVRVEKAKIYLELAYEHRRLLSHLPPVRGPEAPLKIGLIESQSKTYNPLQYARNRKLRLRERCAINAEADGWHDVEKVRAWVDAVMSSHSETSHDPLECVRLPPLSLREDDEEEEEQSKPDEPYQSPRSSGNQNSKPRRPKSDWVTHPGDLIADAYWLEQGLNKTKIQDRDYNQIYPANTQFKFSGWRNRTPIEIPQGLQQPTPSPDESPVAETKKSIGNAPELPTFRSAHRNGTSRGRKRSKLKDSIAKAQSDSRKRALGLLDSSSDSGSDDASNRSSERDSARHRYSNSKDFDLPDGDPFSKPITGYRQDGSDGAFNSSDLNLSAPSSKRSSVDQSRLVNILKRNSMLKSSSHERGRSRDNTKRSRIFNSSKDYKDVEKQPRSSYEYDSASPNSPIDFGLPSIAINLDPPSSRSPSPTKKSRSGFFQSLKDKPKHPSYDQIDTTDFAKRKGKLHSRDGSVDATSRHDSSGHASRGTSPYTKTRQESIPPEDLPMLAFPKSNNISRVSTRSAAPSSHEQASRIRGIFKGGRIAELVGNEVSRVGDYIWKRDLPHSYRHQMSGSEASLRSYDHSDTDEDLANSHAHKTPSRDVRHSVSTQSSSGGGRRSVESHRSMDKSQLHNPNLPSFTSPFQRDREKQDKKPDLLAPGGETDHISRQAVSHRASSRSPRLDRLPKLEITAPQAAGLTERGSSYHFGDALTRSQTASRAYNDLISAKPSAVQSAKTSAATLSNQFRKSLASTLDFEGSDDVSKRDIVRVKSMLLISAVKARNITASYNQIPATPSRLLLDTIQDKSRPLYVRRRDEYALAGRNLITALTDQSDQINRELYKFSDRTIAQLHKDIQSVEDQIENTITPRVRVAADSAGELSVKLTTTSTQAVKSLQDVVGEAFRLRRTGPSRWVMSLGYGIIEWAVVGLLWFIWAMVTIIRTFLGLFRGVAYAVRWLLWIE